MDKVFVIQWKRGDKPWAFLGGSGGLVFAYSSLQAAERRILVDLMKRGNGDVDWRVVTYVKSSEER